MLLIGSSVVTVDAPRKVTRHAITHAQKPVIPAVAQSVTGTRIGR